MTNATPETSKPVGRLPTLNALAARININNPALGTSSNATSVPAPRPRLAASVLRTGSTTSLATTASTTDSMAVNVPSTRSTSPSAFPLFVPPAQSTTPSNDNTADAAGTGDPLTSEKLEKHNQETLTVDKHTKMRYKNIPTLDAITARLAKTRTLSVDGTAKPPEPEMIEDPKTPGVPIKAPEHPLQFAWTIYHDTKTKAPITPGGSLPSASISDGGAGPYSAVPPDTGAYEAGLTVIGEFDTVESFCRYFNWLKPPSKLEKNSNYHLFKSGIKPMWEDEANAKGGKWVLTMKNNPQLLDRCWSWLTMALVGEELEEGDEICGAVVSLRSKVDRIQLWTRSKDDVERLNSIGKKLVKLLDVSEADGIGLEFQYNTDDRPLPNKFLSIQAMPATGFRSSNFGPPAAGGHTRSYSGSGAASGSTGGVDGSGPVSAGPVGGGAFGSFQFGISGGVMAGSGVAAWRGKKGN